MKISEKILKRKFKITLRKICRNSKETFEHAGEAILMLQQVIHRVRCLTSERPHKIVACKNEVFIAMRAMEQAGVFTRTDKT